MTIHRRYRICRRHFDSDCLNGGCRRLLNTAVPTLHLGLEPDLNCVRIDEIEGATTKPNFVYLSVDEQDDDELDELIVPEEATLIDVSKTVKSKHQLQHLLCL